MKEVLLFHIPITIFENPLLFEGMYLHYYALRSYLWNKLVLKQPYCLLQLRTVYHIILSNKTSFCNRPTHLQEKAHSIKVWTF